MLEAAPAEDPPLPKDAEALQIPLKYSLPCDSRKQIHKLRIEKADTQSFLRGVDSAQHSVDRQLSRTERHINRTVDTMNLQTERMRRMIFNQMITNINNDIEERRLCIHQSRTQGPRRRAVDMTAAECRQFAQSQVDLFEMQVDKDAIFKRITRQCTAPVQIDQTEADREARSLITCHSRLDKIDLQFLGPCPRVGVSDSEVKQEIKSLIALL